MFQRWVAMNAMAVHAGLLGAALQHVASVGIDVAISSIESVVVSALQIHFEISKQIVANNEIIGVRQSGGLGMSTAQVALAAS